MIVHYALKTSFAAIQIQSRGLRLFGTETSALLSVAAAVVVAAAEAAAVVVAAATAAAAAHTEDQYQDDDPPITVIHSRFSFSSI